MIAGQRLGWKFSFFFFAPLRFALSLPLKWLAWLNLCAEFEYQQQSGCSHVSVADEPPELIYQTSSICLEIICWFPTKRCYQKQFLCDFLHNVFCSSLSTSWALLCRFVPFHSFEIISITMRLQCEQTICLEFSMWISFFISFSEGSIQTLAVRPSVRQPARQPEDVNYVQRERMHAIVVGLVACFLFCGKTHKRQIVTTTTTSVFGATCCCCCFVISTKIHQRFLRAIWGGDFYAVLQ